MTDTDHDHDHDHDRVWDAGLQPERTALAWRRLAVTLLVLALVVAKLAWTAIGVWAIAPSGLVAAGAITLLATSHHRYLDTHQHLTSNNIQWLPDGRLPLITVLTALTLAAIGLAIVTS